MESLSWKRPDLTRYESVPLEGLPGALTEARVSEFLEDKISAISPDAPVRELLFRMVTESQLALVVWRSKPHGVVTYLDALLSFASGMSAKVTHVEDIAREENTYAVAPDTPVLPLLLWMADHGVPMVIVSEEERFLGIFTTSSPFRHMAAELKETTSPALA